jgi:hypothetical protein
MINCYWHEIKYYCTQKYHACGVYMYMYVYMHTHICAWMRASRLCVTFLSMSILMFLNNRKKHGSHEAPRRNDIIHTESIECTSPCTFMYDCMHVSLPPVCLSSSNSRSLYNMFQAMHAHIHIHACMKAHRCKCLLTSQKGALSDSYMLLTSLQLPIDIRREVMYWISSMLSVCVYVCTYVCMCMMCSTCSQVPFNM